MGSGPPSFVPLRGGFALARLGSALPHGVAARRSQGRAGRALDPTFVQRPEVGMIALMGLDAETGVFMLLFLDLSHAEAKAEGRLKTIADLHEAIVHGAVKRVRPKMMTVMAAMPGLMPIMWSMGTGRM